MAGGYPSAGIIAAVGRPPESVGRMEKTAPAPLPGSRPSLRRSWPLDWPLSRDEKKQQLVVTLDRERAATSALLELASQQQASSAGSPVASCKCVAATDEGCVSPAAGGWQRSPGCSPLPPALANVPSPLRAHASKGGAAASSPASRQQRQRRRQSAPADMVLCGPAAAMQVDWSKAAPSPDVPFWAHMERWWEEATDLSGELREGHSQSRCSLAAGPSTASTSAIGSTAATVSEPAVSSCSGAGGAEPPQETERQKRRRNRAIAQHGWMPSATSPLNSPGKQPDGSKAAGSSRPSTALFRSRQTSISSELGSFCVVDDPVPTNLVARFADAAAASVSGTLGPLAATLAASQQAPKLCAGQKVVVLELINYEQYAIAPGKTGQVLLIDAVGDAKVAFDGGHTLWILAKHLSRLQVTEASVVEAASAELQAARERQAATEGELQALRRQQSSLEAELAELEARRAASERQRADLQGKLATSGKEVAKLADESKKLQASYEECQKAKKALEAKLEQKTKESEDLGQKLQGQYADKAACDRQYRAEIAELKVKMEKLSSGRHAAEGAFKTAHEELRDLQARLTSEGSAAQDADRDALERELTVKESELAEVARHRDALAVAHSKGLREISQLEAEKSATYGEMMAARTELAAMRTECEQCNSQLVAVSAKLHMKEDEAKRQCAERTSSMSQLQDEIDSLRQSNSELAARLAEAEQRHRAATSSYVAKSNDVGRLEVEMDDLQASHEETEQAKRAVEAQLEAKRREAAELQSRLLQLERERESLVERVASLRAEKGKADAAKKRADSELAALRGQFSEVLAKHRRLESSSRSMEEQLASAQDEAEEVRRRLTELEERDARGQEKQRAAASNLQAKQREAFELQDQLQAKLDEVQRLQTQLQAKHDESEKLRGSLQVSREEAATYRQQSVELLRELEEKKQELLLLAEQHEREAAERSAPDRRALRGSHAHRVLALLERSSDSKVRIVAILCLRAWRALLYIASPAVGDAPADSRTGLGRTLASSSSSVVSAAKHAESVRYTVDRLSFARLTVEVFAMVRAWQHLVLSKHEEAAVSLRKCLEHAMASNAKLLAEKLAVEAMLARALPREGGLRQKAKLRAPSARPFKKFAYRGQTHRTTLLGKMAAATAASRACSASKKGDKKSRGCGARRVQPAQAESSYRYSACCCLLPSSSQEQQPDTAALSS
eukprot:TRINITY_DN10200_c0_g1_i1.p1 TRINITY_DN10200_c0_g1~~TRINITY_DN10200_c0_g1_i1.p1  ORF type:complete len:1201 (+),score=385.40 TRINITY_DN10200_c0_g1_i1:84-3686(+)